VADAGSESKAERDYTAQGDVKVGSESKAVQGEVDTGSDSKAAQGQDDAGSESKGTDADSKGSDAESKVADAGSKSKVADAAERDYTATVQTHSNAAQADNEAGSKEHVELKEAAQEAGAGSGREANLSAGPLTPTWMTPELIQQFMQQAQAIKAEPPVEPQNNSKRKKDKIPKSAVPKKERPPKKRNISSSDLSCDDDDCTPFENSKRRLNWQKGRQDWSRPSKQRKVIEQVTCDTLAEVYVCMRKYGWAILRDLTDIFAPSARFTREQRDYISKCKSQP
jgi:hypothetical protein